MAGSADLVLSMCFSTIDLFLIHLVYCDVSAAFILSFFDVMMTHPCFCSFHLNVLTISMVNISCFKGSDDDRMIKLGKES